MNLMCFESFESLQTTSRPMCFEIFEQTTSRPALLGTFRQIRCVSKVSKVSNLFEPLVDQHYMVVSHEFDVFRKFRIH